MNLQQLTFKIFRIAKCCIEHSLQNPYRRFQDLSQSHRVYNCRYEGSEEEMSISWEYLHGRGINEALYRYYWHHRAEPEGKVRVFCPDFASLHDVHSCHGLVASRCRTCSFLWLWAVDKGLWFDVRLGSRVTATERCDLPLHLHLSRLSHTWAKLCSHGLKNRPQILKNEPFFSIDVSKCSSAMSPKLFLLDKPSWPGMRKRG